MSIRILLADDHKVMCDGLRLLIAEQVDMEVVGEAQDGRSASRELKSQCGCRAASSGTTKSG